jgi:hypothetical protein
MPGETVPNRANFLNQVLDLGVFQLLSEIILDLAAGTAGDFLEAGGGFSPVRFEFSLSVPLQFRPFVQNGVIQTGQKALVLARSLSSNGSDSQQAETGQQFCHSQIKIQ